MERNIDGPAQPEQRDEGFETGQERPGRHTIEEEREPNFARGQSGEPVPGTEEHGDFATGQEHPPDDEGRAALQRGPGREPDQQLDAGL